MGNTCFIRKPTKRENLWDFQIHLKTLSFLPGSGTAHLTHNFLSSSSRKKKRKTSLPQTNQCRSAAVTRVSMTLVFCGEREGESVSCYLNDRRAKASQRVGNGSQDQFHWISGSNLWRQNVSLVIDWHVVKLYVYFLTLVKHDKFDFDLDFDFVFDLEKSL